MTQKVVRAKKTDLEDLLAQRTNNPLAEMEILRLLAEIISKGGKVVIVDELSRRERLLAVDKGKFILKDK